MCYIYAMEELLVKYLLNKIEGIESIILHGSRASGFAKKRSDWDFILLINSDNKILKEENRANVEGEEIEFQLKNLPIAEENIIDLFGAKLRYAKVCFDKENSGKTLLDLASKIYNKGRKSTSAQKLSHFSFINSALNGMKDNIDFPAMFTKKLGAFYPRIINYWYMFKEESYSDNLYISIPYIKKEDPTFFKELEKVYRLETSPETKIKAAEKLISIIFQE